MSDRLLIQIRSMEPGVNCKTGRRIGFSGATVVLHNITTFLHSIQTSVSFRKSKNTYRMWKQGRFVHTHWTRWRNVLEKLTVIHLVKKFTALYDTLTFISVFITAWTLTCQINPVPTLSLRFLRIRVNIIYPRTPGLQSSFFPSGSPTNTIVMHF